MRGVVDGAHQQQRAIVVGQGLQRALQGLLHLDGVDLAVTADFQPQRVNVVVEQDIVTEVQGLG